MGSAPKLLLISAALASSCNLLALDPSLELSQFSHSSWIYTSGFISGTISAIAQTKDGYLWIGTTAGLYRFDGVRFLPFAPPEDRAPLTLKVRSLMASRDGSLWIGTASALLRLANSRSTALPVFPDQIPAGSVTGLLEDNQGAVWASVKTAATEAVLVRISGHQVQTYSDAQGVPGPIIANLFEDSRRRLWVSGSKGLCQANAPAGIRCFEAGRHKFVAVSEMPDHRLIMSDSMTGALMTFDGERFETLPRETVTVLPRTMITDRKGVVWFAAVGKGLTRLRGAGMDTLGRRQGLTGDYISTVFEDREGDLWVATSGGLDRFRDFPLPRLTVFEGLSGDAITSVAPSSDGAMWVGTAGAGLDRILGRSTTVYGEKAGLPRPTIEALLEDSSHRLWVATTAGLVRGENGRFTPIKDDRGEILSRAFTLTEAGGSVWILNDRAGLYRVVNEQVTPVPLDAAVTRDKDIYQLVSASDGTIWMGHYRGGVTHLAAGVATTLQIPDSKPGTPVNALYAGRDGSLWVASPDGLHRYRARHWTFYRRKLWRDEPVLGVVEDGEDNIWISTPNTLARLSFWKDDPDRDPAVTIIGGGLHLGDEGRLGGPRMAVSRSEQVWVATDEGAVVVDHSRLPAAKTLAAPAIETLSVDGHQLALPASGDAEFRGHEMSLEYTVPEMGQPDAVRFRYSIEGLQKGWFDAGSRRQTAYGNIGPGHYQFCVMAALPGEAWDGPVSCQGIRVLPYFYQTWWFLVACVAAVLALTVAAYHMRIKQMRDRFRLVTRERLRVARELHDTLLQGFAGITYQLEVVSRQMIGAPERSHEKLESTIVQAEASLAEARNAIRFLRLEALEHGELSDALGAACRKIAEDSGVAVTVDVEEGIRNLPHEIEGTLYLVACEAMRNAVRHAQARHITVSVTRKNGGALTLTVQDDGRGFDTDEAFAKERHWGIRGMRERAGEIGAAFHVASVIGQGTRLEIRFPRTRL